MGKHTASIKPDDIQFLIRRCVEGDDATQAEFYNIYYDFLSRAVAFAIQKYQPTHLKHNDVQEITHDIFIHITKDNYAALERLHKPTSLNAWLMRVAQNQVISQLRKDTTQKKAYQNIAKEEAQKYQITPEQLAISQEQQNLLDNSLKALLPQEQLMLKLYYQHGRKYSEIAEILNISINTVASRLHRVKAKLHNMLKGDKV